LVVAGGCLDTFGGSNIQITFSSATQIPGPSDINNRDDDGRPPENTHYEFVAIRNADEGGAFVFEVAEFEIAPLLTPGSPCFIETREFEGLHSTEVVTKLREDLGIPEGAEFDENTPVRDASRVITAARRVGNQQLLANSLKAVVSHSPFRPPGPGTLCADEAGYDPTEFPRNDCIDDASNAARFALCESLFAAHPDYYEGNDQIFGLPLNGSFFGAVDGRDPRNQQPYGGASLFVDTNLEGIDALAVNFQYNCTVEDFENPDIGPSACQPQFPAGSPESSVGFHYMSGTPAQGQQRGILRINLQNQLFSSLRAQAGIYVDLDDDNVNY